MLDSVFSKSQIRVIVADDSDVVRHAVRAILENGLSAICSSARDLDEALKIASDTPVDLALLDYKMPGMDGLNGLNHIRSSDIRHFALLSGNISSDAVEEAIGLGASGFLPKSLPPSVILEAVRAMCLGERFPAQHFSVPLI